MTSNEQETTLVTFKKDTISEVTLETAIAQTDLTYHTARGIGNLSTTQWLAVGGIAGLMILMWLYAQLNVIPKGNEALVRQGGPFTKKTILLGKSGWFIPFVHTLDRVPLNAFDVEIQCLDKDAVRTKDNFRANLILSFQVWIDPSEDSIEKAVTKLSQNGHITVENIRSLLENSLRGLISATAIQKNLSEICSNQLDFSKEISTLVNPNFQELGLTLKQVTISKIRATYNYDLDDLLDAEGVSLHNDGVQKNTDAAQERLKERKELLEVERELQKLEVAHNEGYINNLNRSLLREEEIERELHLLEREKELIDKNKEFRTFKKSFEEEDSEDYGAIAA